MLTQELGNTLYPKRYTPFIFCFVGLISSQGFWQETSRQSSISIRMLNGHCQNISHLMITPTIDELTYKPSGRKPSRNTTDEATFAKPDYTSTWHS